MALGVKFVRVEAQIAVTRLPVIVNSSWLCGKPCSKISLPYLQKTLKLTPKTISLENDALVDLSLVASPSWPNRCGEHTFVRDTCEKLDHFYIQSYLLVFDTREEKLLRGPREHYPPGRYGCSEIWAPRLCGTEGPRVCVKIIQDVCVATGKTGHPTSQKNKVPMAYNLPYLPSLDS